MPFHTSPPLALFFHDVGYLAAQSNRFTWLQARAGRTGLVVRAVASPVKPSSGPKDGPLAKNTKIQLGERVLPRQWWVLLSWMHSFVVMVSLMIDIVSPTAPLWLTGVETRLVMGCYAAWLLVGMPAFFSCAWWEDTHPLPVPWPHLHDELS